MGEEKSVAELAAELDGLVELPEKVEEEPKVEEQPKQKKKPELPKPPAPKQEDPPPLPISTSESTQTQVEETPSFDGAIKSILDDNDKQIDAQAIEAKKKFRKTVNDGLAKLIVMAAEGTINLPVQLPDKPQPSPIIEPRIVKDNSEAIQRIDAMLIDPTVKNKRDLYMLKLQLQGKTLSDSDLAKFDSPVSAKKSEDPETKKGFFSKRRIAALAIGIVAIVIIVVGLI